MTTTRRVQLDRAKLAAWVPCGRHGTGPRTMPDPLPAIPALVASIKAMGVSRAFLSEPAGASPGGHYRFLERVTSALNPDWRHYAAWSDDLLTALIAEGITPVWYMGCPQHRHEMGFLDQVLGSLPDGCEVAFDAASGQAAGSYCHEAVLQFGPKRFYIEALPWKGREHWRGMRVIHVAGERINCEADRLAHAGKATGPMDDADFSEVIVAMTGHPDRKGRVPTDRDAQRFVRQGLTLAVAPWDWARYEREVFEVAV